MSRPVNIKFKSTVDLGILLIRVKDISTKPNKTKVPFKVGILIFKQVELLDVAGPFEVFAVTRLNEEKRDEESSPFDVKLVSQKLNQVKTVGGLVLTPDFDFYNCPVLDILIVPGGQGTRSEINNKDLLTWISNKASKAFLTASVCTGSSLLGKTGLLDHHDATTHWKAFEFLKESAPKARILKNVLFTNQSPIFTSAGISSGIGMALYIVSLLFGIEIGKATAKHMQFPYPDDINIY